MDLSATHLILCLLASFVIGLSKGGLASAATLSVPILSIIMDPIEAAAMLLPVYLVTDIVALLLYRRGASAINLKILLPSSLVGVALAAIFTPYASESILLIIAGGVGVWFCLKTWLTKSGRKVRPANVWAGSFWGVLTGITSFITHSGGPPLQAFLLPQHLPKAAFIGTLVYTLAWVNFLKLPGYWSAGLLHGFDWELTIFLIIAGICGTYAGRRLAIILPDHVYRRVIEILLFILSLALLAKAVMMF